MMIELIITGIVSPIIPTMVAYFLGRKKAAKEIDSIEAENWKAYVVSYKAMLSDLQSQIKASTEANQQTRDYYRKVVDDLNKKIDSLTRSNKQLSKEIKEMKMKFPCPDCKFNA